MTLTINGGQLNVVPMAPAINGFMDKDGAGSGDWLVNVDLP